MAASRVVPFAQAAAYLPVRLLFQPRSFEHQSFLFSLKKVMSAFGTSTSEIHEFSQVILPISVSYVHKTEKRDDPKVIRSAFQVQLVTKRKWYPEPMFFPGTAVNHLIKLRIWHTEYLTEQLLNHHRPVFILTSLSTVY